MLRLVIFVAALAGVAAVVSAAYDSFEVARAFAEADQACRQAVAEGKQERTSCR